MVGHNLHRSAAQGKWMQMIRLRKNGRLPQHLSWSFVDLLALCWFNPYFSWQRSTPPPVMWQWPGPKRYWWRSTRPRGFRARGNFCRGHPSGVWIRTVHGLSCSHINIAFWDKKIDPYLIHIWSILSQFRSFIQVGVKRCFAAVNLSYRWFDSAASSAEPIPFDSNPIAGGGPEMIDVAWHYIYSTHHCSRK